MEQFITADIVDRMKSVVQTTQHSELARSMGKKSGNAISNWISRDKVDYKSVVEFGIQEGVSLTWLFTGAGVMRPGENPYCIEYSTVHKWLYIGGFIAAAQAEDLQLMKTMALKMAEQFDKSIDENSGT